MKKTIMFILMLAVCLLVVPSVYAEEAPKYAKIDDITNPDTLKDGNKPVVKGSEDATTTITINAATFQLLGEEGASETVTGGNRPGGYAWIGFRVTMPDGATEVKLNEEEETASTFDKYYGFKVSSLENVAKNKNGNLTKTYTLKWKDKDGATEMTQTINIVIVPENIVLYNNDNPFGVEGSKPVWNDEIWFESVQKVVVTIIPVLDGKEIETDDPIIGEMPANYTLTSEDTDSLNALVEASIKEELKETKIKYVGLYTDSKLKNKYDWSTKEDALTIYMAFETVKDEKNPATGDKLLTYISIGAITIVGALGIGLYLKKANE